MSNYLKSSQISAKAGPKQHSLSIVNTTISMIKTNQISTFQMTYSWFRLRRILLLSRNQCRQVAVRPNCAKSNSSARKLRPTPISIWFVFVRWNQQRTIHLLPMTTTTTQCSHPWSAGWLTSHNWSTRKLADQISSAWATQTFTFKKQFCFTNYDFCTFENSS